MDALCECILGKSEVIFELRWAVCDLVNIESRGIFSIFQQVLIFDCIIFSVCKNFCSMIYDHIIGTFCCQDATFFSLYV